MSFIYHAKCPKCGSRNVYIETDRTGKYEKCLLCSWENALDIDRDQQKQAVDQRNLELNILEQNLAKSTLKMNRSF